MPQSVCMYLRFAMRDTVVSWTPTSSATSLSVRGARRLGPSAKKCPLELDHRAGDLEEGLVALMYRTDEEFRLLDVVAHVGARRPVRGTRAASVTLAARLGRRSAASA